MGRVGAFSVFEAWENLCAARPAGLVPCRDVVVSLFTPEYARPRWGVHHQCAALTQHVPPSDSEVELLIDTPSRESREREAPPVLNASATVAPLPTAPS